MGIMVDHIQVTSLSLDTTLYPRQTDGDWEGPWTVEGIIDNGETIRVLWRMPYKHLSNTFTEWKSYDLETVFDSSYDGWTEQEDGLEDTKIALMAEKAWQEGYRVCDRCGLIIDAKDTAYVVGGDSQDRLAKVFHDDCEPFEEMREFHLADEAWLKAKQARQDAHAEDLETAHSQSCDIEPRHGFKDCPNNPQAWKITLLVTSSNPEWMDSDLPRFFGPLEVIAFAEAVEGSGEGFAEAMTLDEAEQLRL